MCSMLSLQPLCKESSRKKYDPNNDPVMLRAKIKAYEEIVADKDALIQHYETMLQKRSRKKSV